MNGCAFSISSTMILILLVILSVICVVLNFKRSVNYWKRRGVPFVATDVGTTLKSQFYNPVALFDHYANIYEQLSHCEYGGSFWQFRPQFVVREPELIKCILIKDFDHFRDRGSVNYEQHDPITNHIFSAPGDLWRGLRIRLTPTFTSGKMKFMFGVVKECAEEYQQSLQGPATHGLALDFKELSAGYTIEVINSTAFGLKSNSISDPNSEFKKVSHLIFQLGWRFKWRRLIREWFPFLKTYTRIRIFDKKIVNFFFKTVRDTVQYRKQTGVKRNDFLQLLITLNEGQKETLDGNHVGHKENVLEMTNELMTAQCFLFFVAGFDTSSLVLSMTLLELAMNRGIQEKLQQEIDERVKEYNGIITYEMIRSMTYLHKVVQESMRKYPVLSFISRICTKTYQVPGTNLVIEKGIEVIIPLSGIHRDPRHYPDPEKYDPERFTVEEIQKRHHFAYLPFGEGPRNCIGSRFGLMSVKLGLVHLLYQYNFHPSSNTVYPVKFKPNKLLTACNHEVQLRCSMRTIS